MGEDVSSGKPVAQDADASRLAALLRPYLCPITRERVPVLRSALPDERLDALNDGLAR